MGRGYRVGLGRWVMWVVELKRGIVKINYEKREGDRIVRVIWKLVFRFYVFFFFFLGNIFFYLLFINIVYILGFD